MHYHTREESLNKLENVRRSRLLLQKMIPNWEVYKKACLKEYDKAMHVSIFLNAIMWNNSIDFILEPLECFILDKDNNTIKTEIRKQYLKDLEENWIFKDLEIEKYKKFNIFISRIIELNVAYWFLRNRYDINNLEAWDEKSSDIVLAKDNNEIHVEVKYIPRYKIEFENSLKGKNARWINNDSAKENLFKKIEEAAKQLKKKKGKKIVVIVIEKQIIADYFISTEICKTVEEKKEIWKEIFNKYENKIDEVLVFHHDYFKVAPRYYFDITKNLMNNYTLQGSKDAENEIIEN